MPAPDIDFDRIRPYGDPPSWAGGFEELASVVIRDGIRDRVQWPEGTRFDRFGNPDGGREGKGTLPDGVIWAWQVKYLFEFDASAARQVGESISRVLRLEPALRRYFVAVPIDLPAGDRPGTTSAHTRWTTKVAEWEQLAKKSGLDVEFVFVGAHDLVTALTEPRHEGRARYWFDTDVLGPPWQQHRIEEVVAKVGPRYSPQLHVVVDPVRALDAVARTDAYLARWRTLLAELRRARRWPWHAPDDLAALFDEALAGCATALDIVDDGLQSTINAANGIGPLPALGATLSGAADAADGGAGPATRALSHPGRVLRQHCGHTVHRRPGGARDLCTTPSAC